MNDMILFAALNSAKNCYWDLDCGSRGFMSVLVAANIALPAQMKFTASNFTHTMAHATLETISLAAT
ncbi:hypothetical protein GN109_25570 [Collimonas pratensis]|uniref:hypothetical protein n=1 Tax=Collimonas pratensis TaxID=279113 RepID=UPI00143CDFFE|nr:hypothetical protein [Collimonas pratensis]NKI72790.1 hypothetical protein [Collimonas pratensis]